MVYGLMEHNTKLRKFIYVAITSSVELQRHKDNMYFIYIYNQLPVNYGIEIKHGPQCLSKNSLKLDTFN